MLRTLFYLLLSLSVMFVVACDDDANDVTPQADGGPMMDEVDAGDENDPYSLGGTYHDYRSCEEQDGNPNQEPEMEGSDPEMEMSMEEPEMNTDAERDLRSMLPVGDGAMLADGLYVLRLNLVELALVLDVQMEVIGEASDTGGTYTSLILRAIDGDTVSEPFGEATDVAVDQFGHYVAEFNDAVLPGDFSPSGSDVLFNLTATGLNQANNAGCGFLTGELVNLDLTLADSTFGIAAWADRGEDVPTACDDSGAREECVRLTADQCPDLVAGENTITSCGIERRVRITVPEGHSTEGESYKTVVLFHGLTDDQVDDIEEDTALNRLVTPFNFVLLSPYSRGLPFEWDQGSPGDNADVALFDDLLTCAEAKLGADSERLYAAGDSIGGLFTTMLMTQFTERLAAAAINSGGTFFDFPEEHGPAIPIIFTWGGECDTSRGQSFTRFAENALPELAADGHFLVTCNHDTGHEWKPLFSPWMLEFLFAHSKSDTLSSPFMDGLSDAFPEYCTLYEDQ